MKYYTNESWSNVNSGDINTTKEEMQKWDIEIKKYWKYFETIKGKLPKGFIKIYEKFNFHDFQIYEIKLINNLEKKPSIIMIVYDFYEDYGKDVFFEIIYRDVKEYICAIGNTHGRLDWGYDEFEFHDNGLWEHRIISSNGSEIKMIFKKISINKIRILSKL